MILVMLTFIIDSTPTSQICTFRRGPTHIVENFPYKSNQIPTFMTEPIFGTTQLVISINSQIPMIQVPVVLECNLSFTIAPSYPITQMLSDQYPTKILLEIVFYQPTLGIMDRPM